MLFSTPPSFSFSKLGSRHGSRIQRAKGKGGPGKGKCAISGWGKSHALCALEAQKKRKKTHAPSKTQTLVISIKTKARQGKGHKYLLIKILILDFRLQSSEDDGLCALSASSQRIFSYITHSTRPPLRPASPKLHEMRTISGCLLMASHSFLLLFSRLSSSYMKCCCCATMRLRPKEPAQFVPQWRRKSSSPRSTWRPSRSSSPSAYLGRL